MPTMEEGRLINQIVCLERHITHNEASEKPIPIADCEEIQWQNSVSEG